VRDVPKVLVAVPAFNEQRFLASLLFDILSFVTSDDIVVIDDGSTDDTAKTAQSAGVHCIRHSKNQGKGAALQTAIDYANAQQYNWIIFMDGDGQHNPRDLEHFYRAIAENTHDVIIGNRQARGSAMPLHRQLSNGTTSVIISLCAHGQRIHDSQCGYRAIRLLSLQHVTCSERGFQFESEILLRLAKVGVRIKEIPIQTTYAQEASSIQPVRDTLRFITLILKSFTWT